MLLVEVALERAVTEPKYVQCSRPQPEGRTMEMTEVTRAGQSEHCRIAWTRKDHLRKEPAPQTKHTPEQQTKS